MFDPVALYVDEQRGLERYFARRVRDQDLAADLTAETYLQALRGRDRYEGHADDAVRWLYGIARHVLQNYRRHARAVDSALLRAPVEVDVDGDYEREPAERAQALPGLRRTLAPALDQLPQAQRDALDLRVLDELSYQEVADRLSIDAPLARMRVSRALHALAATLAASGIDNWLC
jgi:RNA polymerase sigma factor (sigma-70 family)